MSALSAFLLGALGENLFVAAEIWTYEPAALRIGSVPAFIPVAYALAYAVAPLVRPRSRARRAQRFIRLLELAAAPCVVAAVALVLGVSFGLTTGFFSR